MVVSFSVNPPFLVIFECISLQGFPLHSPKPNELPHPSSCVDMFLTWGSEWELVQMSSPSGISLASLSRQICKSVRRSGSGSRRLMREQTWLLKATNASFRQSGGRGSEQTNSTWNLSSKKLSVLGSQRMELKHVEVDVSLIQSGIQHTALSSDRALNHLAENSGKSHLYNKFLF